MFEFITNNWIEITIAYAVVYAIAYIMFVRLTPRGKVWAKVHEPKLIRKWRQDAEDILRYRIWRLIIIERILDPFLIWANILRPQGQILGVTSITMEEALKVSEGAKKIGTLVSPDNSVITEYEVDRVI